MVFGGRVASSARVGGGRASGRGGFTLIETMVSLAIMSVLFVAMGSTVMVAARAMPDAGGPLTAMHSSSTALDVLTRDLALATEITEAGSRVIELKLPDIDADNLGPTVRYEWSGVAGASLTRRVNSGSPIEIARDVHEFVLTYATHDVTTVKSESTTTRSSERLFATFSSFPALSLPSARTCDVGNTKWFAQRFVIDQTAIPADATAVGFTRVELTVRRQTGGGDVMVAIHPPASPGSSNPGLTPVGAALSAPWASLPSSFASTIFTLPEDTQIAGNGTLYHIVVSATAAASADVRWFSTALGNAGDHYYRVTTDSGASWSPTSGLTTNSSPFAVYGYFETTTTADVSSTDSYLRRVNVRLRSGGDSRTQLDTSVAVLNEPEMP